MQKTDAGYSHTRMNCNCEIAKYNTICMQRFEYFDPSLFPLILNIVKNNTETISSHHLLCTLPY